MRSESYQWALISCSVVASACLSVFVYRELFPEYKIYQNRYLDLEAWRSKRTDQPMVPFKSGIKQIVMVDQPAQAPRIDRCISCHVAVDLPHFSKWRLATDVNGKIRRDASGKPLMEPNPDYLWGQLDEEIANLRSQGDSGSEVAKKIELLESWKSVKVGAHTYDMTRVLQAHPLLAGETRAFEFHSIEEFGCTSCHNGNGRGLTTERSHGPVFDGQYHAEDTGPVPVFQEREPSPPEFAHVYNSKPASELLFQTTPLFVGQVLQASCAQCHQSETQQKQDLQMQLERLEERDEARKKVIEQAKQEEKMALIALCELTISVKTLGWSKTQQALQTLAGQKRQTPASKQIALSRLLKINSWIDSANKQGLDPQAYLLQMLHEQKLLILEDASLVHDLDEMLERDSRSASEVVQVFLERIYTKPPKIERVETSLIVNTPASKNTVKKNEEEKQKQDPLHSSLSAWQQGQSLYISQACYACHKIAGFSRGSVGPELTQIGYSYPWYVKQSIVWPQADLISSTMPNFMLDHEDIESLMAFLMSQRGKPARTSAVDYKLQIRAWEAGAKLPWEQALDQSAIKSLTTGQEVFVTQGCASCHRIRAFNSHYGFSCTDQSDQKKLDEQSNFFQKIFEQELNGHEIVEQLRQHREWIDQNIIAVRTEGDLERLEAKHPGLIETYHTPFKVAGRLLRESKDNSWQEDLVRLKKLLAMYVQIYGLGREIGPNLHFSGIYRSSDWLMEHFKNPGASVARSIMPVFPFDETKFEALTYFLREVARHNRNEERAYWQRHGFDPELAFDLHCAQCHGKSLLGNGPVARWIYPIPKNLRQPTFLRNLTKERALESVMHGVSGSPMPAWSKSYLEDGVPVLTPDEAASIVEWLFSNLPGGQVLPDGSVPKWQLTPEAIEKEIKEDPNYSEASSTEKSSEPLMRPPLGQLGSKSKPSSSLLGQIRFEVWASWLQSLFRGKLWADSAKHDSYESDIFDRLPAPEGSVEPWNYYIKEKFYTQKNLDAAWPIFLENCAHCHGSKGAGDGVRAVTMQEAKPRMLTNVAWLESHDDLRLLRSIKYGVPGTAMISFADVTTPLQRLQLVVLIRSLSLESQLRDRIHKVLTEKFRVSNEQVELKRYAQTEMDLWWRLGQRLVANLDTRMLFDSFLRLLQQLPSPGQETWDEHSVKDFSKAVEMERLKLQTELDLQSGKLMSAAERERIQNLRSSLQAIEQMDALFEQTLAQYQAMREKERFYLSGAKP